MGMFDETNSNTMTKLPLILDDFVNEEQQDKIESSMFDCYYKYQSDIVLGNTVNKRFFNPFEYDITPSFTGNLFGRYNKKVRDIFLPTVFASCEKIGFVIEKIERCYVNVQHPFRRETRNCNTHVNREVPHLVMLYYVNDCDGDTILFDKTINDIPFDVQYPDEYCDLKIVHRISPKRGRILFFDGITYHAPSTPINSIRCIITLDIFGKFVDGSYNFPCLENKTENQIKYFYG